jgi:hypothetical protein
LNVVALRYVEPLYVEIKEVLKFGRVRRSLVRVARL